MYTKPPVVKYTCLQNYKMVYLQVDKQIKLQVGITTKPQMD